MVTNLNDMTGDEGISLEGKLRQCVDRLVSCATCLRAALMNRSADEIWDLLAMQEEHYSLLDEYAALWHELHPPPENGSEDTDPVRVKIRDDLQKLRALQQSNARMAQALLSAVRKGMSEVSAGASPIRKVYNRRGRMGAKASSVLVRRFG